MRSLMRVLFAAMILAICGAASFVEPAVAADTDVLKFSVTAANDAGADGRKAIDMTIAPGETATDRIAVRNLGRVAVTFAIIANDGLFTPMGNFDIRASDQEPQDAGGWFAVDSPVEVEAGQTVVVPFTVTVPELATPGDHPAGIAATVIRAANTDGVGIESRAGVRVNIRVPGILEPRADVVITSTEFNPGWNPLAPGELTVTYEVMNEGNARLEVDPLLKTAALFGLVTSSSSHAEASEILPGGRRTGQIRVESWPTVITTAEIRVKPTVIATEDSVAVDDVRAQTTVVSLPVPQAIALAVTLLVVLTFIWRRRMQRAKLDAMIADAREQGRRDATT